MATPAVIFVVNARARAHIFSMSTIRGIIADVLASDMIIDRLIDASRLKWKYNRVLSSRILRQRIVERENFQTEM